MRNPFASLAGRDGGRPSLRERLTALRASAPRAVHREPPRVRRDTIPALDLSSVPLNALFALADIYSTGVRHFEVAGFWPKLQGGDRQPAADIIIHEGDRLSLIWRGVTDEIARRRPDAAVTSSVEEHGEWSIRRALADCRWADAEKAAATLRNALGDES